MQTYFTESNKLLLRGIPYKLAKKYNCSHKTVSYVLDNNSPLNTPLTISIAKDLKYLIKFFQPVTLHKESNDEQIIINN